MAYTILTTPAGQRDYRRVPPEHRVRIRHALLALGDDPRGQSEKLQGKDAYRKRVGDYRIIFRIDDAGRRILIARIKHRRDAYRR